MNGRGARRVGIYIRGWSLSWSDDVSPVRALQMFSFHLAVQASRVVMKYGYEKATQHRDATNMVGKQITNE